MADDQAGSSWITRARWAVPFVGLAAAFVARQRLRSGAASVARLAADTLETSSDLVERSVRGAGRVALLPADATLALARDRLLGGIPEAADTKWRVAQILLRSVVVSSVARSADIGSDLDAAGETYARASLPEGDWDAVTLRETVRRATHALDLEGTESRRDNVIELITTACPIVDSVQAEQRPSICEAICGERSSLLHGLAVGAGAQIASPERMGLGATRCLRRLTLPPVAAAPVAVEVEAAGPDGKIDERNGNSRPGRGHAPGRLP